MKSAAIGGLLVLVSWSAQAADAPVWRAGAAISFSTFQWAKPDQAIDDNGVGAKIYAQYQFNNWLGIEGAYRTTGDFSENCQGCTIGSSTLDGNLKLRFKGFSGHVIGYVPLPAEGIKFFGKVGYYDFDDELSIEGTAIASSSENGLVAGGGVAVDISDNFGLRAEYEWFDADIGDLWSINLGVEYFFGGTKKAEPAAVVAPAPAAAPEPVPPAEPPPPEPPPPPQ